jgi:FKBP-type peptidyl-prolyl cis-trans isomerase
MSERAGQRIAAFVLAAVFFVSSVALTGFVIWQIRKDSQDSQSLPDQTPVNNDKKETNKLQGTKLADFTPLSEQVASLQKTDLVVGTGEEAPIGANVTVHYTGALASTGVIFESSKDGGKTATFGLGQVIKGWQDGVPGMKVGGKRRLVIPYADAYGEAGSPPSIPAKSDLVFDIELVAVNK